MCCCYVPLIVLDVVFSVGLFLLVAVLISGGCNFYAEVIAYDRIEIVAAFSIANLFGFSVMTGYHQVGFR